MDSTSSSIEELPSDVYYILNSDGEIPTYTHNPERAQLPNYSNDPDSSYESPPPFRGRGRARGRSATVRPTIPGPPIRASSPLQRESLNDLAVSPLAVDIINGRGQPRQLPQGLPLAPATYQRLPLLQHFQPPPLLFPQETIQQPLFPQIPQPPRLLNTSFQLLEMTINRTIDSENSDRYYESEHYEPDSQQFDDAPSDLEPLADSPDSPSDHEPIPDSPDSPSYEPSDMSYQDILETTDYYEEPSTDDEQAITPTAISPPTQTSPTTAAAGTAFQGLGVLQPQRFCEACRRRINTRTRPSGYRSE